MCSSQDVDNETFADQTSRHAKPNRSRHPRRHPSRFCQLSFGATETFEPGSNPPKHRHRPGKPSHQWPQPSAARIRVTIVVTVRRTSSACAGWLPVPARDVSATLVRHAADSALTNSELPPMCLPRSRSRLMGQSTGGHSSCRTMTDEETEDHPSLHPPLWNYEKLRECKLVRSGEARR